MLDAILLSMAVFACFLAGHAAILVLSTCWRPWRAAVRPRGFGSLRHALPFVAGESLMLALVLSSGLVRLASFSLVDTVLVLALSVPWWELYFYLGHRLLHTPRLFRFHRSHHEEARVHPSLTFGLVETALLSSGFYLPLAAASHGFAAVSVPTLVVALGGAYVLNVLAHLDAAALSEVMDRSVLRHLFNSPRYHARHHTGAPVNFGLNAPWFDRLFGTELGARS